MSPPLPISVFSFALAQGAPFSRLFHPPPSTIKVFLPLFSPVIWFLPSDGVAFFAYRFHLGFKILPMDASSFSPGVDFFFWRLLVLTFPGGFSWSPTVYSLLVLFFRPVASSHGNIFQSPLSEGSPYLAVACSFRSCNSLGFLALDVNLPTLPCVIPRISYSFLFFFP